MKGVPVDWYEKALMVDVKEDVESRSELQEEIKPFYKSFIRFAARQRVNYERDIDAEWSEYKEKYLVNRLSIVDLPAWKKLSLQVLKRDHFTCQYCGKTGGKLEVDHKLPVSRGGTSLIDNLVTACRHCNRQKRDKTANEYLKWKDCHE